MAARFATGDVECRCWAGALPRRLCDAEDWKHADDRQARQRDEQPPARAPAQYDRKGGIDIGHTRLVTVNDR
jgi:hypothetical protein